ncbi:Uma2 family endonuclease [Nibrella saemangeumensis]|uniref:Uma2 family endonuclease n=1 Tax=Nibrella saemangeumensis TaxID=1084526 RepID=A0ABP8N953_9BACT
MTNFIGNRVADLLDAPDAKLVIERAQAILNDEALRRKEFREWLRDDVKAEFINGEVIMHSPAKEKHLEATENLSTLLRMYVNLNSLGTVHSEKALVALTRNDYEPDICYWSADKANDFFSDQMKYPAPDLVVEVLSKSTAERDKGVKFEDYAAHGVCEYWIIDPTRQTVEQYQLDEEFMAFETVATLTIKDTLSSKTVSGFQIPVRSIFDRKVNLTVLQEMLKQ